MSDVSNNNVGKSNISYENLVSIAAVIFVFMIGSGFFTFARQYPPEYVDFNVIKRQPELQGYTRPKAAEETTPEQAGARQISLLEGLSQENAQLLQQRFDQAASLLHAGQFAYAITALDQVIKIQPRMPEAYVNLGYAYLGLNEYQTSANAFSKAIDLRPNQVNAYYGLAEALEGLQDYEGALGAMRSYVHLSSPDDPFATKARAAIWELETKLGRNPQIEQHEKSMEFDSKRFVSPHN
ncbi:MAG: tetratricopeptide repeat protein [Gammaproteobacteria bacterium]|nr:tetratricopeptide repeat protein [Gammaproteobacteria bacterium]